MRNRETFIVTLFRDPERTTEIRGRLRHIISNRGGIFKDMEELDTLFRSFLNEEEFPTVEIPPPEELDK